MPRLRLPPLPPVREWRAIFPKTTTGGSKDPSVPYNVPRESVNRTSLADPGLCDKFVRDLGLREGEVVIDAYCAAGQLTRSLLAGGYNETTPEDWARVVAEQPVVGPQKGKVKRRIQGPQFDFPPWDVKTAPKAKVPALKEGQKIVQPKLVVANEPHITLAARALGFMPDMAPPSKWEQDAPQNAIRLPEFQREMGVYPSLLEKNMVFSCASVYLWPTIPKILSDPLVWPSLEVWDKTKKGVEATHRPWSAPPPPITLLATLPNTVMGDQLMSQWVSSAIGSDEYGRSWLWKWGRVRVATLVPKGMYDRIMAQPGETIHCKLSVMAHALFHLRPLPPYHHVPNVDKQSMRVNTDEIERNAQGQVRKKKPTRTDSRPAPSPTTEVTPTRFLDFYRWTGVKPTKAKYDENAPLDRPALLGIEFIPRADPLIRPEQREMWDFVLRRCFVRETSLLGEAASKIAFGAENLLPRFSEPKDSTRYAGDPVTPDTIVRNLTVPQWARVVDVFDKWAFKPDNLHVEAASLLDESREIGMSV